MRFFAFALAAVAWSAAASAQVYVHGYTKKDGTYVAPHYRSSPDSTRSNNYSTIGNINPYTGQPGTKSPYGSSASSGSYGSYASPYSQPSQSQPPVKSCTSYLYC